MAESPVFLHPGEDAEMDQASKQARQTFRYFWRELSWERRRIVPGLSVAAVKVAFQDPPGMPRRKDVPDTEHMWISDIDFDGQLVSGTLLNQPNWLQSVSAGDSVQVEPRQVNDWMYALGDDVYGGFTVQVIRRRMTSSERKSHDQAWGLKFTSPEQVQVVPLQYVNRKPGIAERISGNVKPATLSEIEAHEHPMAMNMVPSLQGHLQQNPRAINECDEQGFTLLHSLAMAGTCQGVQVLLQLGANKSAVTKKGYTPARLAKILGWTRVMQLLDAS